MTSKDLKEYPGMIAKDFKFFNPIELARQTEAIAGNGNKRLYTNFYCTGVYRGISTGYAVGCCLRCIFCWVALNRDHPFEAGRLFSPDEVFDRLLTNAQKRRMRNMRISGSEPTLCRNHLIPLLELASTTDLTFILETNGILFGYEENYVEELKKIKNIHVRVSIKSGNALGFEKRTGALKEFFRLPFQAVKYLQKYHIRFHVACMNDARLITVEEKKQLPENLAGVGYTGYLEEEECHPYDTTIIRLEKAGYKIF